MKKKETDDRKQKKLFETREEEKRFQRMNKVDVHVWAVVDDGKLFNGEFKAK